MRVRLRAPLRFNLTGYDREPVLLPEGEQDAPPEVAEFLRANPDCGEVLAEAPMEPTLDPDLPADPEPGAIADPEAYAEALAAGELAELPAADPPAAPARSRKGH